MSTRVADRVDDWDTRSFTGGYYTLDEFASEEFSGVIRASGAELYMTRGTVVGVRHGSLEDFEDGSGTAYEAPIPGLPLLAVMQEANGEVQAQYYSEKTAISEVDSTLSDGGFTGYIELAENVLSGDYYVVYHAGESTSVGFVGQSGRLIHGDEAFETANNEVGIYQVRPADIEPVEIPAVDGHSSKGSTAVSESDEREVDTEDARAMDENRPEGTQLPPEEADESETADSETSEPRRDSEQSVETGTEQTAEASTEQSGTTEHEQTVETGTEQTAEARTEQSEETRSDRGVDERATSSGEQRDRLGRDGQQREEQRLPTESPPDQTSARKGTVSVKEIDVETRAIPSIDPARTADPNDSTERHTSTRSQQADTQSDSDNERAQTTDAHTASAETARLEELQAQLQAREDEIEGLESELDRTTKQYEDVRAKLETAEGERDELAREVERLENELDRLEAEFGAATDGQQRMAGATALAQTDIFPRYNSKSDATLKKAHGGSHRREKVSENLRLEKNTQFDESSVSVNGQTYTEFLDSTLEYQFVEWVIGDLLFEIRETGNEKSLRDLYDALPVIDRADLSGTVDVVYTEDGQETRSQESFDIVLRNRMGEPLIVANLNDSREGATESMMEQLVRSAERVGQTNDDFAGAFLVTRSFFEPSALETADDATKGGLFSRDKRKSYVNLSRKTGYHLCLVEARNRNFTLLVPEL